MNKDKIKDIIRLLKENEEDWVYVSCEQMILILEAILDEEKIDFPTSNSQGIE